MANIVSNALKKARDVIKRLEQTIAGKNKRINELEEENEKLRKENEKLKEKLQAARKPPSWAKPNTNRGKRDGRSKKGPKQGHSPNKRTLPEQEPDQSVEITPLVCSACNHDLPKPGQWHSHTQIDIPEISLPVVTEFKVGWSWCSGCNKYVSVNDKLANTKYGPRLHAYVAYLKFDLGLSFGKIRMLLIDQYMLEISTGELAEIVKRTANKLKGVYDDLKASLLDQDYLHADETGWRVGGDNYWLWSFANNDLSFYAIRDSRGQIVVEDVLGKSFSGTLITDFYNAYNAIDCDKQKCWVHLLRELREIKEKSPDSSEIRCFSNRLGRFFQRAIDLQSAFEADLNIDKALTRLKNDTQKFANATYQHKDLIRLAKRLHKHRGELYTFIKTGVDPTNNFAEREIRPTVLMRKISYGNTTEDGARTQSIIMSLIRTYRKQGQNFINHATHRLEALH